MARSRTAVFITLLLTLAGACRNPAGPGPDPAGQISFRPVSDVRFDKVLTPTMAVTYAEPIADGGVPPLTVKCDPSSGSSFPTGTTVVTCTASDGVRTAETHFNVTLIPIVPVVQFTKFLAFGDSITEGAIDTNPVNILEADFDPPRSYPTVLGGLLRARYTDQSITVVNRGQRGESAAGGAARISGELDAHKPQVLLLLEGVNGLDSFGAIPGIISALRSSIRSAKDRSIQVFISTLTPEKDSLHLPRNDVAKEFIPAANDAISALAAEQGVILVDAYGAMNPNKDVLIGGDGLHPTAAGMVVLAETFMKAIREKLELPPGSAVPTSLDLLFSRPGTQRAGRVATPLRTRPRFP